MAPVKKSKSAKASESINTRLQLVVKSGKVRLISNWTRNSAGPPRSRLGMYDAQSGLLAGG